MHANTSLSIPQPCSESWAAMSPAAAGRHCAACAHTVVDFTLKTDAEILAYLAGAAAGRTCGRFAAGQLERPLQRAAPVAPAARWRAWLAAAVAVWAVREGIGTAANAQATTEWRARYWGGPVPASGNVPPTRQFLVPAAPQPRPTIVLPLPTVPTVITLGMVSSQTRTPVLPLALPALVLRGVIIDAATGQGLPGVTVLLKGTTIGTSTDVDGAYELPVSAEMADVPVLDIVVSSVGYLQQERLLTAKAAGTSQSFQLQAAVMGQLSYYRPFPWHPRAFYFWGKYWLTRPFRRD